MNKSAKFFWVFLAVLAGGSLLAAPGNSSSAYSKLRDRNEKRIKEITKFISSEAKKQQDAWVLAKRAEQQANNPNGNSYPSPNGSPAPQASNTPAVPDKFTVDEAALALLVTKKFGGNLLDAAGPFPRVDIRQKIELQEAANDLPEIHEKFDKTYEIPYDVQAPVKEEALKAQNLLKAASKPGKLFLQLQLKDKSGEWVELSHRTADLRSPEWRVLVRLIEVSPQAIGDAERALVDMLYPLYRENENVEISFSLTDRVARRTFKGAFKRIGRFKLSIGKDIMGLNDLPENLRARFDKDLNEKARRQFLDRHPIGSILQRERQEAVEEKVREMLTRQFEQNLACGWIFINDAWKVPADIVQDVLQYRRQYDGAARAKQVQDARRMQNQLEMENEDANRRGGGRRY